MPYTPPGATPGEPFPDDAGRSAVEERAAADEQLRYEKLLGEHEKRAQEQRARVPAQRILRRHMLSSEVRRRYGIATVVDEALRWTIGTGIDLSGANLGGADFRMMDLTEGRFDGADLAGTLFVFSVLRGASFDGASLSGANLLTVDLGACRFQKANLTKANLGHADLTGAVLSGANLTEADLFKANMTRAILDKADLTGAELFEVDLSGATWTKDTIWPSYLQGMIKAASVAVASAHAIGGRAHFCVEAGFKVPGMPTPEPAPETA